MNIDVNDMAVDLETYESSQEIYEPFDPQKIKINRKALNVGSIVTRLRRKSITLAPSYQRGEVWDLKKKSQLIESLLLRIPLPSFYVAEGDNGEYEVVDGQQRLTAIRDFYFENGNIEKNSNGLGFKLEGLEYLKKFEGHQCSNLPTSLQQNMEEGQLDFIVIDNNTAEDVKFIIFSRINRGGVSLSEQEVRHALYNGPSSLLLGDLSDWPPFRDNYLKYFAKEKMGERELILRALAFMVRPYTCFTQETRMADFLSETMLIINATPNFESHRFLRKFGKNGAKLILLNDVDEIKNRFVKGFKRSSSLFKEHAFRRSLKGERKTPVNKALFEVWVALFSTLSSDKYKVILSRSDYFFKKYRGLLADPSFQRAITRDVLTATGVATRHKKIQEMISDVISS